MNNLLDFIAVILYMSIFCFAMLGFVLYCYAYFEMKRTRIIGSVAWLLLMVALDTFIWATTEFQRFVSRDYQYPTWMVSPGMLIVTKSLLLSGVLAFVINSVREDKRALKECAGLLKGRN